MKVLIAGASGHGKEVAEVIAAQLHCGSLEGELAGFLDDRLELSGQFIAGLPVLGSVDRAQALAMPAAVALGVGYPETKARVLAKLDIERFHWPVLVHPNASVGRAVELKRGTLIQAGVALTTNVFVAEFVTVNVGATISHDCTVERLATLSPGVRIGGGVHIGEGAFLGIGASVAQGVRIGAWSVVGAGAVVLDDVPPHTMVAGVPARVIRKRAEDRQGQEARPVGRNLPRIHLSLPHLSGRERELVNDALDSGWIAPLGTHLDAFEAAFAQEVGVRYAVAVNSGTAALHLGLHMAGVRPGDEVVVPSLTFVATANPVRYLGAVPLFLDSEPLSWNLDPDLLEDTLRGRARTGRRPAAVLVAHLYGQSAQLDRIVDICQEFELPLIEDAAESLGSRYGARSPGSFGRCGIFSFNGNKIITTSAGGMLVTNDGELAARALKLATQAREPAPHYQHTELGYNYRMSNLLAAVGLAQLGVLSERVQSRRRNFEYYRMHLGSVPGITFQAEAPWGMHTRWLTTLLVDEEEFGADSANIRLALEAENIEARPLWKPMHMQPLYRDCAVVGGRVSEMLFAKGLCLPSGSTLTAVDLDRVVEVVLSCRTAQPRAARPGVLVPMRAHLRTRRPPAVP